MTRPERDRAAGYVEYPDDDLCNPNWRRLTLAGKGAFSSLKKELWKTPEVGVVEDDDRLLAELAHCSLEEWLIVRPDVIRMFETRRAGKWVLQSHVALHVALRLRHETSKRTGAAGGKASARKRKGSTAAPAVEEPVQQECSSEQQNREQSLFATLRDSTNGEPSAPLRSAEVEAAAASSLRCEAAAPPANEVVHTDPVDNSATADRSSVIAGGEPDSGASSEQMELRVLGVVRGAAPADHTGFPRTEAWCWIRDVLVPAHDADGVLRFMCWVWNQGTRDLELVKGYVETWQREGLANPYAYFAKGSLARGKRELRRAEELGAAEAMKHQQEERRFLAGGGS